MSVRFAKNKGSKEEIEAINSGIKIKDDEGREGVFLPTFRIENDKGELAMGVKLKEDSKPVFFVYYIVDEEFVKRKKIMENFTKMAKENNWKMIDARDLLASCLDEVE